MHDPLLVRRRQPLGGLDPVIHRLARGERRTTKPLPKRLPLQKLRDHIGLPAMRPDVVDREDVGMVQGRGRPSLLLESAQPVGIGGEGAGQDLDRHLAPEARVPGAIDLAHASGAQWRNDLVGAQSGPGKDQESTRNTALPFNRRSNVTVLSQPASRLECPIM